MEGFGFVTQMLGFIQPAFYASSVDKTIKSDVKVVLQ